MQENNSKDTLTPITPTPVIVPEVDSTIETTTASPVPEMETTTASPLPENTMSLQEPAGTVASSTSRSVKKYILAAVVIAIMMLGLVFLLEKEGRISTGLFSAIISKSNNAAAVALVNGTKIIQADLTSSLDQLTQMAAAQGANTTDPALATELKTQALDTLVNGELLRQAALTAGIEASAEEVDTRFAEIEGSVGGPEALTAKMSEFSISEKSLRRDIENEILIQGLYETVIDPDRASVTEEEIIELYEQAGGEAAKLPPLEDVRPQIIQQIEQNRQQVKISEYLETLRSEATIEILI